MSNNRPLTFTLPNGIKVPEDKIGMFTKNINEKDHDPEMRIAMIREVIQGNPGKSITFQDFSLLVYGYKAAGNLVSIYIKRLMKSGRVTRTKGPGFSYYYTWHNQRPVDPDRQNGPVVSRKLSPVEETLLGIKPKEPVIDVEPQTIDEVKEWVKLVDDKIWEFVRVYKINNISHLRLFSGYLHGEKPEVKDGRD